MKARALRLPMLSIALSLSVSFCARADICFDTMSGGQSSAYIVHMDADDNTVEVEITGNVQVKSLRPAGDSAASGIPRDKLLIRIPEIKLNFAENPHAEYHDFFETMEEAIGLSGQHDGFLNTKIQRAGSSIRIDSEEYTDYSTSGSFETVFINNREFRIEDEKNSQPIRFIVPDPPEIYLYYKQEEVLGEQYIFSGLPDEFLLHDIYLGAYAVHLDHPERREQMMERLLRLRYQDLYYQIRYALHDPAEETAVPSAGSTSYQTLTENLTYLSLPELRKNTSSGRRSGRASAGAAAERYAFVGWKLTELGAGAELSGPCRSEQSGLPQTKRKESPMLSFLSGKAAAMGAQLHEEICAEEVMTEAAMVTIEAQQEAQKTQATTEMQQKPGEIETRPREEHASQETTASQEEMKEGGEEVMVPDETAIAEQPDGEKIASPSSL